MKKATQPTFLLRGVNHQKLVREYLNSGFKDLSLSKEKPSFSKSKGTTKTHLQETGIGRDSCDPVYERKSGENRYRVYTTNSDKYRIYLAEITTDAKSEDDPSLREKQTQKELCDHCRQEISGDILVVPIEMQKKGSITIVSGEYVVGHYCCALAIIREELRKNPLSAQYKSSEQILKQLCFCLKGFYPKNPAPYWKLLDNNGGSMNSETFYGGESEFRKNPSLVFAPVKSQWETKLRD